MPLEINEIGIRMNVRDAGGDGQDEDERKASSDDADCRNRDHEAIVEDCVRRVLRILETLDQR
jgi:hypothetical protein